MPPCSQPRTEPTHQKHNRHSAIGLAQSHPCTTLLHTVASRPKHTKHTCSVGPDNVQNRLQVTRLFHCCAPAAPVAGGGFHKNDGGFHRSNEDSWGGIAAGCMSLRARRCVHRLSKGISTRKSIRLGWLGFSAASRPHLPLALHTAIYMYALLVPCPFDRAAPVIKTRVGVGAGNIDHIVSVGLERAQRGVVWRGVNHSWDVDARLSSNGTVAIPCM